MFGPLFAMPPGNWYRDTAILVVVVLALAILFVRSTPSGQGERGRRVKLGYLAFLGGPTIAALLAGLVHAFGHVSPLDVGDLYSSFIGIGVIAGILLGLAFGSTSLLCSNDLESSSRKPNP